MAEYWSERYAQENTPWDMGNASPPLTGFLQGLQNKKAKILIPGAGHAYEAEWLHKNGFTHVFVIDLALAPLENLRERCPDFPQHHLIQGDFFDLEQSFDLVIEQTFFCAIQPSLRTAYVEQMHRILNEGGKLVGVLFNFPLTEQGPPFGGSFTEYIKLFEPKFSPFKMLPCYNSIKPRAGKELFIHFIRA